MKTFFNKAMACILAAVIAAGFLSLPVTVSAQEPVILTVAGVKGEPGKDVVVSVNISAASGLGVAEFILKYDNSKLLYKSYQKGAAAEGGFLEVNPNYKNQDGSSALSQAFIHPEGVSVGGAIVDFTFTVTPDWTGSASIMLEVSGDFADATSSYSSIPYEIINGAVTVGDAYAGNVDAGSAASALKTSSRWVLRAILSVGSVLVAGAIVVFVIRKKKQ